MMTTDNLEIWEGVHGVWHYHLSKGGREGVLCGNKNVMSTNLPLRTWGMKTHLNESYCKECEEILKRGE